MYFRQYNDLDDLQRMKQLLVEILKLKPHSTYHPGDMNWRVFVVSSGYSLQDMVRLWVDERDNLSGWLFIYPSAKKLDLVVHPTVSGTDTEAQMLEDVEQYLLSINLSERLELDMFVFADDAPRRSLLEAKGYSGNECRAHFAQSLVGQTYKPILPDGFRFLKAQEADHAERRAELHVDAFSPGSTMTTEKYRALMGAPDYDPEMDVVIVAPDDRYAAFALGWDDAESKMGLFEPVGTRRVFQRLGLGQAALHEAMRRMQVRGIETATVRTSPSLTGVMPFYQTAGFQIMNTIYCYQGFVAGSSLTIHNG